MHDAAASKRLKLGGAAENTAEKVASKAIQVRGDLEEPRMPTASRSQQVKSQASPPKVFVGGMAQEATKSNLRLDTDVMLFFESEIQPKLNREKRVHGRELFADQFYGGGTAALAHQEVLADWHDEGMIAVREAVRRNLVRSLQAAVEAFQKSITREPIETRLQQIEGQLSALRGEVVKLLEVPAAQKASAAALDEVSPYLDVIRAACTTTFGWSGVLLSVKPSDGMDHPLLITLDLSSGDSALIAQARAEGARRSFYESLLTQIPDSVFDAVEFDFRFPKE